MSRAEINNLLERYLKGETSDEETLRIEKWLAEHENPDNEWEQLDTNSRQKWLNEVFADVESSIAENSPVIVMPLRKYWKVTAAAAVLIICFSLLWRIFDRSQQLAVVRTGTEQTRKIVLSDGSQVSLNEDSELRYTEKFNDDTREVFLTGEAYFDVKHDSRKTFIVHTGSLKTTVLGTAFNIKAGKADKQVIVTVSRGKVGVNEGKRLLGFITPNQQISYDTERKTPVKRVVNAEAVIAWQSQDLLFEDITFKEAAKILSERFDVKITFSNNSLKECRFSGTALKGKNIDQILKVVCAFNNANYQHKKDNNIVIDGRGCN